MHRMPLLVAIAWIALQIAIAVDDGTYYEDNRLADFIGNFFGNEGIGPGYEDG